MACTYAQQGVYDKSLGALNKLTKLHPEYKYIAENDLDFTGLKKDQEYRQQFEQIVVSTC
jgi:hypothetical protein